MPVDWGEDEDAGQIAFERAALDAAQGYITTLSDLDDALRQIDKLKAQIAALVGLERDSA